MFNNFNLSIHILICRNMHLLAIFPRLYPALGSILWILKVMWWRIRPLDLCPYQIRIPESEQHRSEVRATLLYPDFTIFSMRDTFSILKPVHFLFFLKHVCVSHCQYCELRLLDHLVFFQNQLAHWINKHLMFRASLEVESPGCLFYSISIDYCI